MRVLVVDDDPISVEMMVDSISADHEGHIETAADGAEALRRVQRGDISLVVSDWMMPEMSGIELCRRIRAAELPRYIYFILVTSREAVDDLVEGLAAGADEFIRKPFDPTELNARIRSISRLKELHDELEERVEIRTRQLVVAMEAAHEGSRMKTEFLSNMSHELRTPMNGIIGMTALTLETTLTDEQRENLECVKGCADDMFGLIEKMLEFSRVESGMSNAVLGPFSIQTLVDEVLEPLRSRAAASGLELDCDVAPDVTDAVVGDADSIQRILANLADNAVRFTQQGRVTLRVVNDTDSVEHTNVRFDVVDTGIGIPADRMESIFEPFTQADGSASRKYQGTGVGLTIAARLADLIGGRLWVESELGRGSAFHLAVRLNPDASGDDVDAGTSHVFRSRAG